MPLEYTTEVTFRFMFTQ